MSWTCITEEGKGRRAWVASCDSQHDFFLGHHAPTLVNTECSM